MQTTLNSSWLIEGKDGFSDSSTSLSLEQLRNIYHLKVSHYKQEAEAAKMSAKLLTDKLTIETAARAEAQVLYCWLMMC